MKVIVKPSENTLTQIEVTTSETREKELLEMREEVYKFLNPDNRVIISSKGKVLVKENKGFYRLVKTHKDLNGYDLVTLQKLLTPKTTKYIPHVPTPKQSAFLLLNCKEAFYGGAAGGGKSDALLMCGLQYVDVK